jgi:hypothetical protein
MADSLSRTDAENAAIESRPVSRLQRWAEVDQAVELLRSQGRRDLGGVVDMCHEEMLTQRQAAAYWRQRCEDLMAKHEPRTNVEPYTTWTGD